ncbi:hypothetical protein [Mesorhizobium sp. M0862]
MKIWFWPNGDLHCPRCECQQRASSQSLTSPGWNRFRRLQS